MHVSRLQKRALKHLKEILADEPAPKTRRRVRRKPRSTETLDEGEKVL
jgi:hypothetical protein